MAEQLQIPSSRDTQLVAALAYRVLIPSSVSLVSLPNATPRQRIETLPPEVLANIYNQLDIAPFQICFGLTCKTFAAIASGNNVKEWRGFEDKNWLMGILQKDLRKLGLRLCFACWKLRILRGGDGNWIRLDSNPGVCPPCLSRGWKAFDFKNVNLDLNPHINAATVRMINKP